MDRQLTGKQKKFCEEYIFDFNASRAAREAGYSEDTAGQIGFENLKKPEIQAFIEELQADLAKTLGISKSMVLREHQKLAFSTMAGLREDWITLKEFNDLTPDQKACISEIQTQTRREKDYSVNPEGEVVTIDYVKIKLWDKQKSLDSLSKMLGYDAPKKIEHSGSLLKNYEIVPASKETRSK
jgi:phage terminase small subunit